VVGLAALDGEKVLPWPGRGERERERERVGRGIPEHSWLVSM
jgi:hypothetical protein